VESSVHVGGRTLLRPGRTALLGVVTAGFFALASCASYSTYHPVIPKPVTVEQVLKMSKSGVAPDEIIRTMRDSRTVYRLTASQLAQLRDEGVPDKVINYMQQTYLAAVRRSARFEEWGYWHHWGDGFWYGGEAFGWPYYWYWPDDDFFFHVVGPGGPEVHAGHGGHEEHGDHD
jgi:hypothetical protein